MFICINGKIIFDNGEGKQFTPGIFEGPGAFETMLFHQGRLIFINEHIERMRRSLRRLGISFGFRKNLIENKISKLALKNSLKSARVRYMVCVPGKRKDVCEIIICSKPKFCKRSIKLTFSNKIRKKTKISHLKTTDYRCFKDAFDFAQNKGYDDAILLNSKKEIVECGHSNIFIVKQGRIFTPPVRSGCLNGIARAWAIKTVSRMGFKAQCKKIIKKDLFAADEVFCTNSVTGILPVEKIDKINMSSNKIAEALSKYYKKIVLDK